MKLDHFETPAGLAGDLLARAGVREPDVIADFAAGGGALLKAAEKRWPSARLLANDVDRRLAATLRRTHPGWEVGACDFLASRRLASRSPLARYEGAVDLAILNPPFSDRGGHPRFDRRLGGAQVRSTRAMAFVLASLPWLSPRGEVVAVLPAGSPTGGRDRAALALLAELGELSVTPLPADDLFAGCRVRVCLLAFRLGSGTVWSREREGDEGPASESPPYRFLRGQVNASTARAGALPLIHTTSLQGGRVAKMRSCETGRRLAGPMLLLPRVGKPRPDKLVVWNGGEVVISDCILAVAGPGVAELEALRALLFRRFAELADCYVGSCAPYLTLAGLQAFVTHLVVERTAGIVPTVLPAADPAFT